MGSVLHVGWLLLGGWLVLACQVAGAAEISRALFTRVWRTHEGLPGNEVSGLAQDGSGYLWVAHLNGLARFDGVRFESVELPLPAERGFTVRRLLGVSGDRFWLALDRGLVLYLGPGATNVLSPADGLSDASPLSLVESRDGAIWVGYNDSSVCRIAGQQVQRFGQTEGLALTGSCRLASDSEGQLWFAQAGRAGIWQQGRFQTLVTMPEQHVRIGRRRAGGVWLCAGSRLLSCQVDGSLREEAHLNFERDSANGETLLEDRSGAVWVGTRGSGLYRCWAGSVEAIQTSQRTVLSLYEDREGSIWVGTAGGGLNRVRPRVLDLQEVESGLPFETTRSVCLDGQAQLWAVGRNGGLARHSQGQWQLYSTNEGWGGELATCLAADGQGDVWVGVQRRGALYRWHQGVFSRLERADGLGGDTVRLLLSDRSGALWIGLSGPNGLQRFKQGKFERFELPAGCQPISAATEDAAGQLWVGTGDGRLLRVSDNRLVEQPQVGLSPSRSISCLRGTPDGSLWIGYLGAGLGRLRSGRLQLIGPEHGLPRALICDVMPDLRGAMWFATDQGILRVAQAALDQVADGKANRVNAIYYGSDELLNLQGFPFAPTAAVRRGDGTLFFPLLTGLAVVHPERVATNANPPQVLIEAALVDEQPLGLPEKGRCLQLAPGVRKVEFQFTAPSFIAPASIRFRQQLEGWDEAWNDLGTQRRVSFTRLPPGRYCFRVTACNYAGLWNEVGAQVQFELLPYWWQTVELKVAAGLLLLVGMAGAVRYGSTRRLRQEVLRASRESALHRERARIAKDIHDDLGASLTQISLLSELALRQPDASPSVGVQLRTLAQTTRQAFSALDEVVWAVNPRNDTLAKLLDYLAQFALDFLAPTQLRCRLDFPTQLPHCAVSAEIRHTLYLVLKEALNNVVKHAHAEEVRLKAVLLEQRLLLSIEDNGVGFEQPCGGPEADGLQNMPQRLADIGGRFVLRSAPQRGTTITVELPLPALRPTPQSRPLPEPPPS